MDRVLAWVKRGKREKDGRPDGGGGESPRTAEAGRGASGQARRVRGRASGKGQGSDRTAGQDGKDAVRPGEGAVRSEGNDGTPGVGPPTPDPLPEGPPPSLKRRSKGGRPSNEQRAADEKAQLATDSAEREREAQEISILASAALSLPFDFVAARRGDHWKLSDTERDQFGLAVSRVLVKWLPGLLLRFKDEAALVIVTAMIFVKRVREDQRLASEREREPERKPETGSGALRGDGLPGERKNDLSEALGGRTAS